MHFASWGNRLVGYDNYVSFILPYGGIGFRTN
jgi:hypothetical protein